MAANRGERGDLNDEAMYPRQTAKGREDCPTPDILRQVAGKTVPFDHPAAQHVGLCDACLEDVNRMRHARKRRRAVAVAGGLVAAILVVLGVLATRRTVPIPSPTTVQEATLDLRPFAAMRDDSSNPTNAVPVLPRENLQLSVMLPFGLETGKYEIRLMNDQLRVVQQTTGEARFTDHDTRLFATLNLSALPAGSYRLWIRHENRSWRDFPLEVR